MKAIPNKNASFQVPLGMHLFSGFVDRTRPLWIRLGNLETAKVRNELGLDKVQIDRPIYVTGLARAGTTILLEFLARHRGLATHRYRDFPGVYVPVWWGKGQCSDAENPTRPRERAHADGMLVTPDSPEAIEECLWMAFFPDAHNPQKSNVLEAGDSHPEFEKFYREHIRKLLVIRRGSRYAAKGNYNLTRLNYLLNIFPDARFIIAVRHPRNHIASLMKQHRLFCNGEANFPRALAYMQRAGHYEFGLDRRPINTGDTETVRDVLQLWENGEEARGWARYWTSIYGWLFDLLNRDERLRSAVELVRYEDLCEEPGKVLGGIQVQCNLRDTEALASFADRIAAPGYYEPSFTHEEEMAIASETKIVASAYGYEPVRAAVGANA